MHSFLVLTDTPSRGARLARSLHALGASRVVDLLDPAQAGFAPEPSTVSAVISDIAFNRSAPIAGLKLHLDRLAPTRAPYICLLHEDTARARLQALALGASGVVPAAKAQHMLADAVSPFLPTPMNEVASRVDETLTRMFDLGRTGVAPTPELIVAGAGLIEGALRRSDMRAWLDVVWRFDDATHQHCLLVGGLAAGFGIHLQLRGDDCRRLTEAALLHDIGKSQVPLAILNKPGRLDEAELAVMRTHPSIGHRMLSEAGYDREFLAVVRSHHEMLDGSGYPDGLAGREIPDLVRIVTLCDIFGALIERRPYKPPMAAEAAHAVLDGMGDKLDRDLLRAFRSFTDATMRDECRAVA